MDQFGNYILCIYKKQILYPNGSQRSFLAGWDSLKRSLINHYCAAAAKKWELDTFKRMRNHQYLFLFALKVNLNDWWWFEQTNFSSFCFPSSDWVFAKAGQTHNICEISSTYIFVQILSLIFTILYSNCLHRRDSEYIKPRSQTSCKQGRLWT